MAQFKKGDRIRRISSPTDYYKVGEIYTVLEYFDGVRMTICENGKNAHANFFELVSSSIVSPSEELDKLPEKWFIKTNGKNLLILHEFFKSKKEEYIGYKDDWSFNLDKYYYYPQPSINIWSSGMFVGTGNIYKDYAEITFEQFEQFILNKNEKPINNEVQRTITTDSREIGGEPVRSKLQTSRITTGAGFSINKISAKPSSSRIKESRTTGSFFKSVYS